MGTTMNLTFYVFLSCGVVLTLGNSLENEMVLSILNEFQMNHPTILNVNGNASTISLIKNLFRNVQYCKINFQPQPLEENTILQDFLILTDGEDKTIEVLEEIKEYAETIVLFTRNINITELLNSIQVAINQKVFIIDQSTYEGYETYTINDHQIQQKLGKFDTSTNDFIWAENVEPEFITRRSNFHGMPLKAMTEATGNDIIFEANCMDRTIFFESNQTYLVTNCTSGRFYDIFLSMQTQLNFTADLYNRLDKGWGYVYPQTNGSFHATGMVGDIFFRRADLIVAILTIVHKRALYIDYLNPVAPDELGLFITSSHSEGKVQFGILFHPFRFELWIIIILMSLLIAILKSSIMLRFSSATFSNSIELIWTSFIANFGGKPSATSIDSKKSYKVTVTTSLLSGLIIWIAYRSFLTSELSVVREKLPFEDLEGLANTNWKLTLPSRTSTTSQQFIDPLPNSVYSRISENNMDDNSFIKDQKQLEERLLQTPNTATFTFTGHLKNTKSYANCKMILIWTSKKADLSFGLPKNSPYRLFLNNVLNKMFESGQIKRIFEKWEAKEPSCGPLLQTGNPLSLKKLISIFIIICIGFLLAMVVLAYELLYSHKRKIEDQDVDFMRFEMIIYEIYKNLSKKTRPNVGQLTLLQDVLEKIKKD